MYKLIIADDEKVIRDGLARLLNWSGLGFEIAAVFSDGQGVIEYLGYEAVDVILTDIKMTNVSGIDIAKYVQENAIHCKIVFISGHKEFELAVQGIKYGVDDYLLKPTNVKHVKETFSKIKDALDEKKRLDEKYLEEKEQLDEALPVLKERFYRDLILGVIDNKDYMKSRMALLYPQADLENCRCVLADIRINHYAAFMDETWKYSYDQFEMTIVNFLHIYDGKISFSMVYKSEELIEIFGILTSNDTHESNPEKLCMDEFMRLFYELTATFGFQATYEIKKIFVNIYAVLAYRETIINDRLNKARGIHHLQEQKKLIMSNISAGNVITARKIFLNILDELRDVDHFNRNHFIVEIFSTMKEVIQSVSEGLANSLQPYFNYGEIIALDGFDQARAYCDRIFDKISIAGLMPSDHAMDSLVHRTRQYIADHITRDISQEEIANMLYISSPYLSKVFKKQTGENFSQYVTKMKINKAIELLHDPQYKTYQISEYLGYKTPPYFSRLFRSHTGLNPSEYRSKLFNIGDDYDDT